VRPVPKVLAIAGFKLGIVVDLLPDCLYPVPAQPWAPTSSRTISLRRYCLIQINASKNEYANMADGQLMNNDNAQESQWRRELEADLIDNPA
jgi:hypothetical protein